MLFGFERYPGLLRNIQQIIHHRFQERSPFFTPHSFSFAFRVPRNQRAVGSRGGFGVAKNLNPVVDLVFELVFVDEAVDLHGAEEVADAFADAASGRQSFVLPGLGARRLLSEALYSIMA